MVFSSLIFLCVFFPLNMLIYFLAKKTFTKNIIMLIFSIIFYTWGEPKFIFLLLIITFSNWLFAKLLDPREGNTRKGLMIIAIAIDIASLGYFKYTGFFLRNINSIFGFDIPIPQIVLPIGISFYTFQLISYVVDVYRREVPAQKRYYKLLLYVGLYFQCIAGPIVRYKDVNEDISNRKVLLDKVYSGVNRFLVGLGKKVLLANVCGSLSEQLLIQIGDVSKQTVLGLWVGMFFYMLQIYLDFSAYSDMAIGMGRIIGFEFMENFNYPYIAKSVTEFWRRWHISLSSFLRDYVYIPMGGNRCNFGRNILNLLVVWMLTGFWHGASWNYLLWGIYFFVFLFIEKVFLKGKLETWPKWIGHVYLLIVVFFSWVLFRFQDLSTGTTVLKGMFGITGNKFTNYETNGVILNNLVFIIIVIISVTPLMKKVFDSLMGKAQTMKVYYYIFSILEIIAPFVVILLSIMSLVADSYNPFLYFQF